jgi:holo-[acyl-carrier protein] synthase
MLRWQETAAYNDDQSSSFIITADNQKPKLILAPAPSGRAQQSAHVLSVLPSSQRGNWMPARAVGWSRMIVGTGIDIAEVDRIAASIERFGRRFLERVFTPEEIHYCESRANKAERYAGRFAAKEAAMKAIGTGWHRGVTWQDAEVVRVPGGRPTLIFHGKAEEFFRKLGAVRAYLSITHTKELAMALVIVESEEGKS